MQLDPRPATLGLLLLCAAAAGAGEAEELHYRQGEHRADYDREALLGGQEEVDEYVKLSPEEQHKRLKSIIKKIDLDSDGFLTESELSSWIQMSFKHYAMQEAKQQFIEYDKNNDGSVSWDEYNIQMYDRVIDFDENTALDDAEEESFRQLHLKDKKRFEKANQDSGPGLNLEEFIAFEHPEEVDYMTALHLIDEMDLNSDRKLSEEEILENQDLFLTSEATDYGRQLHDEYFYHDEL
ncbi:hypothetical protein Celaphus_00015333 [Cervus elaphus hippelaphus]|uniref:Reticulocalbin-3 n=1 Tax=Cervus elaphus hippelaphus TaxID=46360 RepID=A0A212CT83_CEREH|nr:hypothetical protein Celaphus_00015333 [Cervus elaphus hippelaphus]